MSIFDSFDPAVWLAGTVNSPGGLGEPAVITLKAGGTRNVRAIVFRDQLQTRAADKNARLEYDTEIEVPMADYPHPNLGGDTIAVKVRKDDANASTKIISKLISQTGGFWRFGLD